MSTYHPIPWQERDSCSSLEDRLFFMYETQLETDTVLIVGDGENKESIEVHKAILIAHSVYFEAQIQRWLISNESVNGKIVINLPVDNPSTIKHLIAGLYKPSTWIKYILARKCSVTEFIHIYKVAHKYNCSTIIGKAISILKAELCLQNYVEIQRVANELSEDSLIEYIKEFLYENMDLIILDMSIFDQFNADELKMMLADSNLKVREEFIFCSLEKWLCNRKEEMDKGILGISEQEFDQIRSDLIKLIRFPVMSIDFFSVWVVPTQLLTIQQIMEIYIYLSIANETESRFVTAEVRKQTLEQCVTEFSKCKRTNKQNGFRCEYIYTYEDHPKRFVNIQDTLHLIIKTRENIVLKGIEICVGKMLQNISSEESKSTIEPSIKNVYEVQLEIHSKGEECQIFSQIYKDLIPNNKDKISIEATCSIPTGEYKIAYKIKGNLFDQVRGNRGHPAAAEVIALQKPNSSPSPFSYIPELIPYKIYYISKIKYSVETENMLCCK